MPDYRSLAKDFAHSLKETYGSRIERIILFGSVARGDYHEDSDIDLLVATSENPGPLQDDVAGDALDLLLAEGVYPSVKVFHVRELERARNTLFGRTVERGGLVLA